MKKIIALLFSLSLVAISWTCFASEVKDERVEDVNVPEYRIGLSLGEKTVRGQSNSFIAQCKADGTFAGVIAAGSAKKYDRTLCNTNETDATKAQLLLSDLDRKTDPRLLVHKERLVPEKLSLPGAGETAAKAAGGIVKPEENFFSKFATSFERNFVREDRWKMILSGTGVTVFISLCSAILGTILGFLICLMRRSRYGGVRCISQVYIRVMQGTPLVVFLMILYYVVFGSSDISATAVAIFGFSIHFSAYVSEMMRAGIDAVDKGQMEAAHAIGFGKVETFIRIVFPQAARFVLPVFKGEFISLVKMTSIVGYIAIQDLTKVSDIIRSRTYEAFFPLIATAAIYFIIAYGLTLLLNMVETKIDPKRRKRKLKGVTLDD